MAKSFLGTVLRLKAERAIDALTPRPPAPPRPAPVQRPRAQEPRRPMPSHARTPATRPREETGYSETTPAEAPSAPTEPMTTSPVGAMMVSDVLGRGSRAHSAGVEVATAGEPRRLGHLAVCGDSLVVVLTRHWSGTVNAVDGVWTLSRPGQPDVPVADPVREVSEEAALVRTACGTDVKVHPLVVLTGGARMTCDVEGVVAVTGLADALAGLGRGDDPYARQTALEAYLRLTSPSPGPVAGSAPGPD